MNNIPQLSGWVVTYGYDGMPGLIQGFITDETLKSKAAKLIVLPGVFSLDLKNNRAVDNTGQPWNLVGEGHQSILTQSVEPFGYIRIEDEEN